MHLFDTDDSIVVAARPKFYITLVVLSISTYITAGLAYWLVRSRKKDGSGRRNGLPKMTPKKQEQGLDSGPPEIDGQGHAERGISALLKNGIENRKERGAGRDKGKGKEASTMVQEIHSQKHSQKRAINWVQRNAGNRELIAKTCHC